MKIFLLGSTGHGTKPGLTELIVAIRPDDGDEVLDHHAVAKRLGAQLHPHPSLDEHVANAAGAAVAVNRWLSYGDTGRPMLPGQSIRVVANGQPTIVVVDKQENLGAIATTARWQTGVGHIAADCWEIRDEAGNLLAPEWPARFELPDLIYVNLHAGIGA